MFSSPLHFQLLFYIFPESIIHVILNTLLRVTMSYRYWTWWNIKIRTSSGNIKNTKILNDKLIMKQYTLNFFATLSFWDSAPPDLCKVPPMDFSDWFSMLDANIRGRWHEHEDRSWIESKCSKSLFFSRKLVVSYVTWMKTQVQLSNSQVKWTRKKKFHQWLPTTRHKFFALGNDIFHDILSILTSSHNKTITDNKNKLETG